MTPVSTGSAASGGGYVVRSGDTLGAIAARNGTTVGALAQANGIANPALIHVGQRLTVPAGGAAPASTGSSGASGGGSYTVRSGDTLGGHRRRATAPTPTPWPRSTASRTRTSCRVGRVLRVPGGLPSSGGGGASAGRGRRAARPARRPLRRRPEPRPRDRLAGEPLEPERPLHAGAIGVMQLMPGTARWLGRDVVGRPLDPHRLEDNIEGGVAYLGVAVAALRRRAARRSAPTTRACSRWPTAAPTTTPRTTSGACWPSAGGCRAAAGRS